MEGRICCKFNMNRINISSVSQSSGRSQQNRRRGRRNSSKSSRSNPGPGRRVGAPRWTEPHPGWEPISVPLTVWAALRGSLLASVES